MNVNENQLLTPFLNVLLDLKSKQNLCQMQMPVGVSHNVKLLQLLQTIFFSTLPWQQLTLFLTDYQVRPEASQEAKINGIVIFFLFVDHSTLMMNSCCVHTQKH